VFRRVRGARSASPGAPARLRRCGATEILLPPDTFPQRFPISQLGTGYEDQSGNHGFCGALRTRVPRVQAVLCNHAASPQLCRNYAGVGAELLEPVVLESKRVLASGGVKLVGLNCPVLPEQPAMEPLCRQAPGPLTLVIQIPDRGVTRRQTALDAFGFAVPADASELAADADVFYDRLESLGAKIGTSAAFGHVIAHELGHVLLGPGRHSAGALWRPHGTAITWNWSREAHCCLAQTERRPMLGNVRRRMLASRTRSPQVFTGPRN
jgi:hypothetical protein